jgi:colanic acid/amylovoran biosynthesis glycosyltransferase
MRIAVLLNSFPVVSETFILRQITGLIDLGHEVDIYAERSEPAGSTHPEIYRYDLLNRTMHLDLPLEVGYYEKPVWPITGRTWLPNSEHSIPNIVRILKASPKFAHCIVTHPRLTIEVLDSQEYGYRASSLSALYRLSILSSCSRKYDILHAHYGPVGENFRFARKLWKVPLVVSFHGYDFSMWPRREGNATYRKLFDEVELITGNCEYANRKLEALGCSPGKLRKLASGVDMTQFAYKERTLLPGEPLRILTVGRLVEKKGIEYSLRAVAKVVEKHADLQYDIVGEGPLRCKLQKLIHELGRDNNVRLHGEKDSSYVRQMMNQCHLFMLTSVTAADGNQEGTPCALLEAQASGIPVVSTWHSGIPEIVLDRQTGFLAPERDVEGLADQLSYLIEHPQIWPDLGRNGRRHVDEYHNIAKLNQQMVKIFEETISRYGRNSVWAHGAVQNGAM